MTQKTAAIAILSVTAAIGAPATPAGAATGALAGGGSFARTIPFIDGNLYAFECHAVAPGAVSTSVDSCALGAVAAPAARQAGPVAVTTQGVSQSTRVTSVCWTVSATFADGTSQTRSGCSTASDLAGAGAG
jgi:hypothetical protein